MWSTQSKDQSNLVWNSIAKDLASQSSRSTNIYSTNNDNDNVAFETHKTTQILENPKPNPHKTHTAEAQFHKISQNTQNPKPT